MSSYRFQLDYDDGDVYLRIFCNCANNFFQSNLVIDMDTKAAYYIYTEDKNIKCIRCKQIIFTKDEWAFMIHLKDLGGLETLYSYLSDINYENKP